MTIWMPCAQGVYSALDAASVTQLWGRLHAGDAEPFPSHPDLLAGWVLYHRGEFQAAFEAGLSMGMAGWTLAHKAACIYANVVEPRESIRQHLFQSVADRAREQLQQQPDHAGAQYGYAYALGRYCQGMNVAKALAQGLATQVKQALERTIALQPLHADAHTALGTLHAEVIDKVGPLIAGMAYEANQDTSVAMFETALRLHPQSITGLIEYAQGLLMLTGDEALTRSNQLFERAISITPLDARETLEVELARHGLMFD